MSRNLARDGESGPDDPLDGRLRCPAAAGVLLADLGCVLLVLDVVEALETLKTTREASEGLGSVVLKGGVDVGAGAGGVGRHSGVV